MEASVTLSEDVDPDAVLEAIKAGIEEVMSQVDPEGSVQIIGLPGPDDSHDHDITIGHREAGAIQIAVQAFTVQLKELVEIAGPVGQPLDEEQTIKLQKAVTSTAAAGITCEEIIRLNWNASTQRAHFGQVMRMLHQPDDETGGQLLSDILQGAVDRTIPDEAVDATAAKIEEQLENIGDAE